MIVFTPLARCWYQANPLNYRVSSIYIPTKLVKIYACNTEIQTSIRNKPIKTVPIKGLATGRSLTKYLEMNSRICPAAKLVANRTTKIKGRSKMEVNSTIGSKTIIQMGAPFGNI